MRNDGRQITSLARVSARFETISLARVSGRFDIISLARVRARFDAAWLVSLALVAALAPAVARAEETRRERVYLTELALLLEGARRLLAYSDAHGEDHADPELARFAYPLAERYVEMASRMLPSPKLSVVHPHLLLVMENLERALDAAAAAEASSYQRRMRIAREELANLEAVLKQLKLRIPELPR